VNKPKIILKYYVPVSRDVAKATSAPPKEEIPFTVNHLFPNIPTNKVPDNS
jgi:hypothetical protein